MFLKRLMLSRARKKRIHLRSRPHDSYAPTCKVSVSECSTQKTEDFFAFYLMTTKLSMSQLTDQPSADTISKTSLTTLEPILNSTPESKTAKVVLTAAKRVVKKRSLGSSTTASTTSPSKRLKTSSTGDSEPSPAAIESSLALPTASVPLSTLQATSLQTNRAPLFLAFAVVLLAYTHSHQPLSSRLSLAQAVVSANSRSKAVHLGLESGKSAEEEGWGAGQPAIKLMGREIRVIKRWGYDPTTEEVGDSGADRDGNGAKGGSAENGAGSGGDPNTNEIDANEASFALSSSTLKGDDIESKDLPSEQQETKPVAQTDATVALWGLDTEALRSSNSHRLGPEAPSGNSLPIFTPQSARNYLLRSFATPPSKNEESKKKATAKEQAQEKEQNCALVLSALDILFSSWASKLSRQELDKRAWNWYVAVRPEVEAGQKGWGGRGLVDLGKIIGMKREAQ